MVFSTLYLFPWLLFLSLSSCPSLGFSSILQLWKDSSILKIEAFFSQCCNSRAVIPSSLLPALWFQLYMLQDRALELPFCILSGRNWKTLLKLLFLFSFPTIFFFGEENVYQAVLRKQDSFWGPQYSSHVLEWLRLVSDGCCRDLALFLLLSFNLAFL